MSEYKRISALRMLVHLLEASLCSTLLLNAPLGLALLIVVWPLALFLFIIQVVFIIVFLPAMVFAALPVSLWLYKRETESFIPWVCYFFLIGWGYAFLLTLISSGSVGFAMIVVLSSATGAVMWGALYNQHFKEMFSTSDGNSTLK